MNLSIVIPVYNEAEKIRNDIITLSSYLMEKHISGEIIISDDASTDDTIKIASETSINESIPLSVISTGEHRGKGNAVRQGILQSKGDVVLFIDSGNTVKLDAISKGLDLIQGGECQMVIGSRHLSGSVITKPLAFQRQIVSKLFRIFIKLIFPSLWRFSDTQCGFKMVKGELAKTLYSESVINGFLFDIEILKKAQKHNVAIQEIPIEWTCDRDSRLSFIPTIWEVIRDSWKLKFK
ncbi:MAG: glycosyltransferase [Candidatus Marinimicrobia bacterium]|nr:glycosyltransferase [Candidatus Neomarinimicrobiota bacterium]